MKVLRGVRGEFPYEISKFIQHCHRRLACRCRAIVIGIFLSLFLLQIKCSIAFIDFANSIF
jgi:hypothetical protein